MRLPEWATLVAQGGGESERTQGLPCQDKGGGGGGGTLASPCGPVVGKRVQETCSKGKSRRTRLCQRGRYQLKTSRTAQGKRQ